MDVGTGGGRFEKIIGDGPAKVAVIPGWFGDHRADETMFDDLDTIHPHRGVHRRRKIIRWVIAEG
jgi:hypothetical protein